MKMNKAIIEYDFQDTPSKAVDQHGSKCYVRIHNSRMITEKEIGERLQASSTITEVDVAGVLAGLERIISEELAKGNTVNLGKICRFEPVLGTSGKCKGTEKGNAIRLKNIRIRPTKSLVEKVETTLQPCTRIHAKHSPDMNMEKVCDWLSTYFTTHESVKRIVLEQELGLTRSLAGKYMHQLKKEGKLLHPGAANEANYYPSPEFFKK